MNRFDLEAIRAEFPVVDRCIYVNHAAIGPTSRSVGLAVAAHMKVHLTEPGNAGGVSSPASERGRQLAATLVGCRPQQVAYIQNTSHGVSLVANGIDWRQGDNVVVPGQEFPSNYLAWLNLKPKGVELRLAPAAGGKVTAGGLRPLIDNRTRVVALSLVQFFNGFKVDLPPLAELCRQHGAMLLIDGTQSIGAMTIDVAATGVDVLLVSAHKWMLGPLGIGFMALSERALRRLSVSNPGWLSVRDPFVFRRQLELLPDAARFEPGTRNAAGICGLATRLEQIQTTGALIIEQRILSLTARLCHGLASRDYIVNSPRGPHQASGIVSFSHPRLATEAVFGRLESANIEASLRAGGVRLSPHYYNSEAEIDFILDTLPA